MKTLKKIKLYKAIGRIEAAELHILRSVAEIVLIYQNKLKILDKEIIIMLKLEFYIPIRT
jgi:hypothetical protein